MSAGTLPELVNIQLSGTEEKELYREVEQRAAADLDTDPEDLTRADVFRWAALQAIDRPDCDHMQEYQLETAEGTVCMRCESPDGLAELEARRETTGVSRKP